MPRQPAPGQRQQRKTQAIKSALGEHARTIQWFHQIDDRPSCWGGTAAFEAVAARDGRSRHNPWCSYDQFTTIPIRPVIWMSFPTGQGTFKLECRALQLLLYQGSAVTMFARLSADELEPPFGSRGTPPHPFCIAMRRRPPVDNPVIDTLCINSIRFLRILMRSQGQFRPPGLAHGPRTMAYASGDKGAQATTRRKPENGSTVIAFVLSAGTAGHVALFPSPSDGIQEASGPSQKTSSNSGSGGLQRRPGHPETSNRALRSPPARLGQGIATRWAWRIARSPTWPPSSNAAWGSISGRPLHLT